MAEAQLTGLLRSLSGTLGNFVFRVTKNGIVVADRPTTTAAVTAEQEIARSIFTTTTKAWKTITNAQRNAWNNYANTYYPTDKDGIGAGPSGQAVFNKANWYRLASGQALVSAAPTTAPPASATALTNSIAADETTIVISVTHPITPVTNYKLFVEITPPLASPARNPIPGDYRAARGLVAASFPALAASAANYTLSPVRYILNEGDRFGCQVTIVDPSGIPSQPFASTLIQSVP